MGTSRVTVTIINELGMHARAATQFVQLASKYPCDDLEDLGDTKPRHDRYDDHHKLKRLHRPVGFEGALGVHDSAARPQLRTRANPCPIRQ